MNCAYCGRAARVTSDACAGCGAPVLAESRPAEVRVPLDMYAWLVNIRELDRRVRVEKCTNSPWDVLYFQGRTPVRIIPIPESRTK